MKNKFIAITVILAVIFAITSTTVQAKNDKTDAELIAQVMYTECRGVEKTKHKAAVAWCILNRVDDDSFPNTVYGVVTQPHQFAYSSNAPVDDELLALAQDVLLRWELEKLGVGDVGRVLPSDYLYFSGNGKVNNFRKECGKSMRWNWALESPYES